MPTIIFLNWASQGSILNGYLYSMKSILSWQNCCIFYWYTCSNMDMSQHVNVFNWTIETRLKANILEKKAHTMVGLIQVYPKKVTLNRSATTRRCACFTIFLDIFGLSGPLQLGVVLVFYYCWDLSIILSFPPCLYCSFCLSFLWKFAMYDLL